MKIRVVRTLYRFIIIGLFLVIYYISDDYFQRRKLASINWENDGYDQVIKRLLYTHWMVYTNHSKVCQSNRNLSPQDNGTLMNMGKLLSQLRNEIIPYPNDYFRNRGIVLTFGLNQLLHLKLNLRILQWSKTKLPIQVWYSFTQITHDIINDLLNSVPKLNLQACSFEKAQCHSLNGGIINLPQKHIYIPQTKNIFGKIYPYKLGAIVSSTFSELIYLDCDCYVRRDPIDLFSTDPMYKTFGVLFYSDIYLSHQHSQLWSSLNSTCLDKEYSLDSGVMILNKKRLWNGLYLTKLMNDHHLIFYQYFFSNGDKDTFRLAFRYMNIPYYSINVPCSTGSIRGNSFCGITTCKTDSLGLNVYFDHFILPKHLNDLTFFKENFTHTKIALADSNDQSFITGHCNLHPLPCFQVGFEDETFPMGIKNYCTNSALGHQQIPLREISSGEKVLWNPNLQRKLLLFKETEEITPGFIEFYFRTQNETIFRNAKL